MVVQAQCELREEKKVTGGWGRLSSGKEEKER